MRGESEGAGHRGSPEVSSMAQAWRLVYCGYDLLGCVAGNHGGIRSATLLGFDLTEHSLVGTATAVGLGVCGAHGRSTC